LTACVEAPVVDYIKLDLQLKDVSLHGCTDIFKLVSAENSDAVAIQVNPAFTTRQGDSQITVLLHTNECFLNYFRTSEILRYSSAISVQGH
jgi:hypothetical protein